MLVQLLLLLLVADWPQFRGPNANGHADNSAPPIEWSDSKNVAWKTEVPGLGWSSPVVVGDRIFLTTAVTQGEGLALQALAYSKRNGQLIWQQEVFTVAQAPAIHTKNSHASPTPIVSGDSVYVHFGPQGTAKLSANDGAILWRCQELDYPPVHGNGGSPVLFEDKLYVICDGSSDPFVAAIDATSGKVAWKTLRSVPARISHSFGTPFILQTQAQSLMLAPGPNHFAAYDTRTGQEVWKVRADGWSVVPQPVISGNLVIYNHDYDSPELIAIRLGGQGDVTDSHIAWRNRRGAPSTPTPILVGDELYYVSDTGVASCVNAQTGEHYWMERLGGNYSASPILTNGLLLFLSEDGEATWLRPSTTFEKVAENQLPGRTFATPVVVAGELLIRTNTHLYKFATHVAE